MDYRCAAPLNPGDTIAVVAPSAALAEDDAAQGIAFLKELGYRVTDNPYRLTTAIWPAAMNCGLLTSTPLLPMTM